MTKSTICPCSKCNHTLQLPGDLRFDLITCKAIPAHEAARYSVLDVFGVLTRAAHDGTRWTDEPALEALVDREYQGPRQVRARPPSPARPARLCAPCRLPTRLLARRTASSTAWARRAASTPDCATSCSTPFCA